MADGVGEDLLGAAQQHMGATRILDTEVVRHLHHDLRRRHAFDQRMQGAAEVDLVLVAQLADDFAHVGQQQLGHRLRLAHLVLGIAFDQVAGDFEVQGQRGQVVADQIVQFARDAHALGDATGLRKQRARGTQLGVQATLLFARLGLAARDHRGDEGETGESEVQETLQDGVEPAVEQLSGVVAQPDQDRQQAQVLHDGPSYSHVRREQPRQHAGHDQQQDAGQAALAEPADRRCGQRHDDQQGHPHRTPSRPRQILGQRPVGQPEGDVGHPPAGKIARFLDANPVRDGTAQQPGQQVDVLAEHPGFAQQRHADAGIGEQARVAEPVHMINSGERHNAIIGARPVPSHATKVMDGRLVSAAGSAIIRARSPCLAPNS